MKKRGGVNNKVIFGILIIFQRWMGLYKYLE